MIGWLKPEIGGDLRPEVDCNMLVMMMRTFYNPDCLVSLVVTRHEDPDSIPRSDKKIYLTFSIRNGSVGVTEFGFVPVDSNSLAPYYTYYLAKCESTARGTPQTNS